MFNIAVIGCGWVASACHGPAYVEYAASHPEINLAACCDVDSERADAYRRRFGFHRGYTNYSEMLEKERPHAVCLNVPPPLTSAMGCSILRLGYPLLTEKPPGLDLVQIDALIASAGSPPVPNQVAFNRRWMPLMNEMKRRMAQMSLHHLDVRLARVHRTDATFGTTAIHVIDAARYLVEGDYQQLGFFYRELPEVGPGVANFELAGTFTNGISIHLGIYPTAGANSEQFTAYGLDTIANIEAFHSPDNPAHLREYQAGRLVLDEDAYQMTGRREEYYLNGFYHQAAAFFDAVQAGKPPSPDLHASRQSVEIMQAIIERKTSLF